MTVVSQRFRYEVVQHLVRNFIRTPLPATPLILAIHGAPGTGKSYQLDQVLLETGTQVVPISSADLESDRANDPARLIRSTYLNLGESLQEAGNLSAAIVINDLDAGLGDWGEMVQTTVNRQLVLGELMHLCDRPTNVTGIPNQRIPIFITANDMSKLYAPLIRPGRSKTFHWSPNTEEITQIVQSILFGWSPYDAHNLVTQFPGRPPSFYVAAFNLAAERQIRTSIDSMGSVETLKQARLGSLTAGSQVDYGSMMTAANELVSDANAVGDYSRSS